MAKGADKKGNAQSAAKNAVYTFLSILAAYVFASWAIDTASMFVYAATIITVLYASYFARVTIKLLINYDKTTTTRRAKKAH